MTSLIDNMRHTLLYLETRVAELERDNAKLREQIEQLQQEACDRYRDKYFVYDHLPSSNS